MPISRRNLLRRIGAGVAATAVAPSLVEGSPAEEPGERAMSVDASQLGRPIRLNRNENAYGPSRKTTATMREALNGAHRYPDTERAALREKIARVHNVAPEQVVLACGVGEILRMAVDAFTGPRKKLVEALPTFELIGLHAKRAGSEVVDVPLTKDYSHDLDAMLARSEAATGLVYICNPNNPTGTLTRRRQLETFALKLPETTQVLIDEAYHHYVGKSSDYASFIDRPVDDGRVIVARTFSTMYGLAGMRLGYAVASPRTARLLDSHRLPEDLNVVAAKAAVTALDDIEHVRESNRRNADDRQEFYNQANARMLRVIDSQTNFVMLNTNRPAAVIVEHFKKNDILVAPSSASFDMHIRVSLGTPAQMREFWRVWDLMPGHKMSM